MKRMEIIITYDGDQISYDDIRDHINHFITSEPAYIKATFYEEEED